MNIRLLTRDEIEENRWNGCVHYATNGNTYGYTWFLDNVSENWIGLVEDNYESVFPLVWNDKLFGIKQLYQPFFAQQHGIYSVNVLSEKRIRSFFEAIPEEYKYININLNERNSAAIRLTDFEVVEKPNYLLYLGQHYDVISEKYSNNLRRNIKKAWDKKDLKVTSSIKPETLIDLYQKHQGPKMPELKASAYHAAHRIVYNALHRGMGFLTGVNNEQGELIAGGFFLSTHNRIVNLMPMTTPEGRERSAMHFLLDLLIRQNAQRHAFLDFEGSSVEGIARFYQSFGAENKPYYQVKKNTLPFWLKWAKP